MKKAILGVVIGTAAYFIWGGVSWMVLPWHNSTMKSLPEETLITDTMKVVIKQPGLYFFPSDKPVSGPPIERQVWEEKYKAGPIGLLIFSPTGRAPMDGGTFARAILGDLFVAAMVMFIFYAASGHCRSLLQRTGLAATLGLLAGLAVHYPYWNWFHFPCDVTVVGIADLVVGFALMGAAMAKFVPEA
jgi:hypothetical protein